jgi:hypothetical protein
LSQLLNLGYGYRSGTAATLILLLAGGSLVLNTANAQQTWQQGLEQRQTIQRAFVEFAGCVRSKSVGCVTNLTSNRGVYLGVDAPLISKQVFMRELSFGKKLRCLFWGMGCANRVLERCALSRVLNGSTLSIDYTRPALYKGDWQVETTVRDPSRQCAQDFSIIWNLEKGFWRIVAIPYM